MDKFSLCHKCGSQLCYTYVFSDITSHNCMSCGFTTNSLMIKGNEHYEEVYKSLPELYKDLSYTDDEGLVWIPMVMNYPEKGMVFIDGSSKDDWHWTAVLATLILPEEKHKFPIPGKENEFYTHKMDMSTKQYFKPEEFVGGLIYIGAMETTEA